MEYSEQHKEEDLESLRNGKPVDFAWDDEECARELLEADEQARIRMTESEEFDGTIWRVFRP